MANEGVNRAILLGNLGADPELKHGQNGDAVLRLRLATTERYVDRNNAKQERTEWHTVTFFGKRAEGLAKHLTRGQSVYIEGRIQTRSWEGQDGNKRYSTEVVGTQLLFLGGGKRDGSHGYSGPGDSTRGGGGSSGVPQDDFPADDFGDPGDDIPFTSSSLESTDRAMLPRDPCRGVVR